MNSKQPDFDEYLSTYNKEKSTYEQLSQYILMQCQKYKQRHPKDIRVVFSRQPPVKEWSSIENKILLKRKDPKKVKYGYQDLEDLIGVTVLCAFESDTKAFVKWIRKAFQVLTKDDDAKVDNQKTGHSGLHYIVKAHDGAYDASPEWIGKKCEIQVKTLLQEAFDAKSHDLAYKPGNRKVSDDMKHQFAVFAAVLRAVDHQSEFLKSLILADEQQVELRRKACVSLYISNATYIEPAVSASTLEDSISAGRLSELLAQARRKADEKVDLDLCRSVAYYALQYDDELFAQQALMQCEQFLLKTAPSANSFMAVATIEWALGHFESAIPHVSKAIEYSKSEKSPKDYRAAIGTFIYLFTDWWITRRGYNDDWAKITYDYVKELAKNYNKAEMDTLGFYKIVFGEDRRTVNDGRVMILKAQSNSAAVHKPFFIYHDYIALKRLLELPPESGAVVAEF